MKVNNSREKESGRELKLRVLIFFFTMRVSPSSSSFIYHHHFQRHHLTHSTFILTENVVTMTCITYFIVIFGGRFLMTNLPAFKLQIPFMIHNVLLTLVSGILLVLMIEQVFPIFYHKGLLAAICADETWTQPLELLYYLNYLVKYWELIDTIFLVLKKKKLGNFFLLSYCVECACVIFSREFFIFCAWKEKKSSENQMSSKLQLNIMLLSS